MLTRNDASADGTASRPLPEIGAATASAENGAGAGHTVSLDDVHGARLLVSDMRVAMLLVNKARDRTMERLFGVSRAQSGLVALIALGMIAQAAHDKAEQMMRGPGGPYPSDFALGAVVLKELLVGISGPAARDTPLLGALLMIAAGGAVLRPALRGTIREIRASSHRVRLVFNHRYGHLINLGRRRPPLAPRTNGR